MANKKVISIEMGEAQIRICLLDYKKKNPKVYAHVNVPTPEGAIVDGYLNDIDKLKGVITRALADNGMKRTRSVIFTADSSKILTREVVVPQLKENMIAEYVKTNCNDYFPIELSGHEISYLILEKIKEGDDAGRYRVLVMAAEKALVNDYEKLSRECGLTLLELDYVGNSIIQAYKNEDPLKHIMILKIEEMQTSVSIIYDGNLLLQRSINYGVGEIIQEVASHSAFHVEDYQDAYNLMRHKACIRGSYSNATPVPNRTDEDEKDDSQEVFEAKKEVTAAAMPFINSIIRLLDFYNSRSLNNAVEQIFVCGMGGDIYGFTKLLKGEIGIKTNVLRRMESFSWIYDEDDEDDFGLNDFVACIGATFAPVGFYSKEQVEKEKRKTNFAALSVLVVIFFAAICVTMWFLEYANYRDVEEENRRLLTLETKYAAAEQVYLQMQDTMDTYKKVYMGSLLLENQNSNVLKFFEELEKNLPSDVMVTGLTSSNGVANISMRVASEENVVGVLDNLRKFDSVFDVSITGLSVVEEEIKIENEEDAIIVYEPGEEPTIRTYVEFTVSCVFYPSEFEMMQAAELLSESDQ